MVQSVTIREYFDESRKSQKIVPKRDRLEFAKAYFSRIGCREQGISFVSSIMEEAKKRGFTALAYISELANKELSARIENDIMEYAAEVGTSVVLALKEDRDIQNHIKKVAMGKAGFCAVPPQRAIDELKALIELEIVLTNERPLYMSTGKNPFKEEEKEEDTPPWDTPEDEKKKTAEVWNKLIKDAEERFAAEQAKYEKDVEFVKLKKTDELPFYYATDKKAVKDWDKMSEEEWQRAKEDEERSGLAAFKTLAAELQAELRYNQALNEYDKNSPSIYDVDEKWPGWIPTT
jgi:hypothetical protein